MAILVVVVIIVESLKLTMLVRFWEIVLLLWTLVDSDAGSRESKGTKHNSSICVPIKAVLVLTNVVQINAIPNENHYKICWYPTGSLIRFRRRNRSTGYVVILPLHWSGSGAGTGHLKWKGKDFATIYIDAGSGAGTRHTSNEITKDE